MVDFNELKSISKQLKKYCEENGIDKVGREYYFDIGDITYIVSSTNVIVREGKHKQLTDYDVYPNKHKYVRIRSSQNNLPRIYEDLKKGIQLDSNGNRI